MKLQLILFLWCFHFVVSGAIYVALMSLMAWLFRVPIIVVDVGFPPRPIRFQVRHTRVAIGLLPSSSSFLFLDESNCDKYPGLQGNSSLFSELALWKQVLLIVGGLFVFLLVALVCLPFAEVVHHAVTALPQIFWGALQPQSYGQELLDKFVGVLRTSPLRAAGILATKFLVWNALPYFPSATYRAISVIFRRVCGVGLPTDMNLILALLLMSPFLVPFLGWWIAVGIFLLR